MPNKTSIYERHIVQKSLASSQSQRVLLNVETTGNRLHNETIESHREIAQAIAAHDPLRAQDAMYLHLVYNRKVISTSTI
ncbi:MAG: FCD domain-containing protein [Anaerostipes sp.]|uniref:FCD domain-containing protein n=1 Tax=Anaerostipes sp. TaxID=1872530 RepID=UPI003970F343